MAPVSKSGVSSKAKKNAGGMKQGTLFSFFSKKKKAPNNPTTSANKSAKAAPPLASQAASSAPAAPTNPLLDKITLGCYIEIFWKNDNAWYGAKVTQNRSDSNYFLEYDDGTDEWLDLSQETFRFPTKRSKKRIRDDTDEEEEQEFQMDDEEEETEFEEESNNELSADEDEEDNWMVTDDEDERIVAKKKSASSSTKPSNKTKNKTKKQKVRPSVTPLSSKNLGRFAASLKVTEHAPRQSKNTPTAPSRPKSITPSSSSLVSQSTLKAASSTSMADKPPAFVEKVVNIAGSHVHNHLKFLQNPKDAKGRTRDDPNYDPRTLWINESDWKKVTGKKMTHAVKQWWDLKKQYFDTVLLFKTGKFYEMFHMDADIGVNVCGFNYMKGIVRILFLLFVYCIRGGP